MENTLEAIAKEELLKQTFNKTKCGWQNWTRNKKEDSSVPGIWRSTSAFKIFEQIPKSQSGSHSNQFASKEQVTQTAQPRQALVLHFPRCALTYI